jgi:hypothetical protein
MLTLDGAEHAGREEQLVARSLAYFDEDASIHEHTSPGSNDTKRLKVSQRQVGGTQVSHSRHALPRCRLNRLRCAA